MNNWPIIASIPPLLIWLFLYVFLARIDARMKALEKKLKDQ